MRPVVPLATVVLFAALLGGCGGSSPPTSSTGSGAGGGPASAPAGARAKPCQSGALGVGQLRVAGVSCRDGRQLMLDWQRRQGCALAAGASRGACTVRPYRCAGVRVGRGIAVSCARPGQAIGFIARRR